MMFINKLQQEEEEEEEEEPGGHAESMADCECVVREMELRRMTVTADWDDVFGASCKL